MKAILNLLAVAAIYIIMVVGLGWFWTIGTSDNYERINGVLINLSYSFLTGYLVYLFTVSYPAKRRSNRINQIVADRLKCIVDERITAGLHSIIPIDQYLCAHSDQEIVILFEQANLLDNTYSIITKEYGPIIDALCKCGDLLIQDIDSIIKD